MGTVQPASSVNRVVSMAASPFVAQLAQSDFDEKTDDESMPETSPKHLPRWTGNIPLKRRLPDRSNGRYAESATLINARWRAFVIVEYIRYQMDSDRQAAFEEAYGQAQQSLWQSTHCLGWEPSRCVEEPDSYILRIEWDSVDGHMQGFRRSPEFRVFFAAIRPYVGDIQEMRHYEQTAVICGSSAYQSATEPSS
jgi:quinol monooxygenase YgiN